MFAPPSCRLLRVSSGLRDCNMRAHDVEMWLCPWIALDASGRRAVVQLAQWDCLVLWMLRYPERLGTFCALSAFIYVSVVCMSNVR